MLLFIVVDGPRRSQANIISIKAAKKSSIRNLERESTDDRDQEKKKNKTGNAWLFHVSFHTLTHT